MAVIYRNNLASNAFAHRLIIRGIPYYLKDNAYNVYDHWIAKDICAYVNFAFNTDDNDAFFRIVNKPGRMVSKQVLLKADTLSGSAFYNVMNADEISGRARKNMEHLYNTVQIARRKNGAAQLMFLYSESEYERY
ncbi:ATP-dependent DNA helicase Rep [bioreactor metagenome]|uniref:ATP-dependent DNA helicase Rep n=1 Tax=bioreactor metagenome TaxID=1076179 RepID=A0A645ECJ3_9ZZZZ